MRRSRQSRWFTIFVAALMLLVGGVAVGWAAATVFAPAKDVVDSTSFTTATVSQGEVSSSFRATTVAEWKTAPIASNLARGTVTSINIDPGRQVDAGASLYSVDLRPTTIAQGAIPAFRDLSRGTVGADVTQLQALLKELGFYQDEPSGAFDGSTDSAVRAWQLGLGLGADGIVHTGDVVFVPRLPVRILLDTQKLVRGAVLTGGEPLISALSPAPSFRVSVTDSQAASIPRGARVEIMSPEQGTWEGFVVSQKPQEQDGTVDVELAGKKGASICETQCDVIPVTRQSLLASSVVTQKAINGLIVPSAGLVVRADGTVELVSEDGTEHTVAIVASAQGMSVVEGVSEGLRVRVPGS